MIPTSQEINPYNMKLHEIRVGMVDSHTMVTIIRIPGGWIYKFINPSGGIDICNFVPFSNDFN